MGDTGVDTFSAAPSRSGRYRRVAAWTALAALAGYLAAAEPVPRHNWTGVKLQADLVYNNENGQRLDLYTPTSPPPPSGWPVVVAIHGGGWRGGDRHDFGLMTARLAQHGIAVAAVDYTLSRPGHPSFPANRHDIETALRWLRQHCESLHLDPTRVAALGASAGAHLAALVGAAPADRLSSVGAVVSLYGPMDLTTLTEPCLAPGGPVQLLLGGVPARMPRRAVEASPLPRVNARSAPMLLIHGTADRLIPADQSRRMAERLREQGVASRLIEVPEATHGFGLVVGSRDLLPDILEFLNERWNHDAVVHRQDAAVTPGDVAPHT